MYYTVRAYFTRIKGAKVKHFLLSMDTSFDFTTDRRYARPLSREMAHKVIRYLRGNTVPTDYGSLTWLKTVSVVKMKGTPRKVRNVNHRRRIPVRNTGGNAGGKSTVELALG